MHPIVTQIDDLERRITYRRYATAVCRTIAVLVAAALLLGAVDYIARYRDTGLRVMSSVAFATVAVWVAYRWWYRPRSCRLSKLAVARRVESQFPQLNDSLASAVEFLGQSEHDQTAGSAQLRRLVVAEAETAIEGLPLDEIIDRRPLRRAAIWLGASAIVLVLGLLWDAAALGTAFARLASPLGGAEWPRRNHLAFRNPPTRLAAGQTFEAELIDEAGHLPDDVRIEYRMLLDGRSENVSQPMDRVGDLMVARRENVRQSFAFRAVGGDDTMMKWHRVEVVEPPQLKSLTVTLNPPKYTGRPRAPADQHLDVLAGTGIEVEGVSNEPLGAARIVHAGQPPIEAAVTQKSGTGASAFTVPADKWIATESGTYQLELADRQDVAGVVHEWNVRVAEDSAPTIEWRSPSEDIYVLPKAVVPISLAVKDNLAVAKVDLVYDRSDWSETEIERNGGAARIEIYRGAAAATVPDTANAATGAQPGESLQIEHMLDLATLDLPAGAEVSIAGEATDYRPGTGRTTSPRRITIVTPEEFDERIAERQSQIVRQLERALAVQRSTRDNVELLQIQHRETGSLAPTDRTKMQSAELAQLRTARILVDTVEGVLAIVDSLLKELEINRVDETEFRAPIERLHRDLGRLATGALSDAGRELAAVRNALDSVASATSDERSEAQVDGNSRSPKRPQMLETALGNAIAAQNDVINTLERSITELSNAGDHQRLARLISELREDQLAHESATRATISVETIQLRLSDLTKAQRAELAKAGTGQASLRTRFEKIEQAMDAAAQAALTFGGEQADLLEDAVNLSRGLAIASKMTESIRDLSENRIGTALDREVQIAADLERVLDALRGTAKLDADQKVARLQEAANELEILRQQAAELRQQVERLEAQPAPSANESQKLSLGAQQAELERQIRQLARELDHLQAAEASQSTQTAADQLKSGGQPEDGSPKPATSNQVQKAEKNLKTAAEQLAQQRQQAEEDLALEIVRRFQTQLMDMVERQKSVIAETEEIAAATPAVADPAQADVDRIAKLTAEEQALAEMAREHSELLVGLGAVRASLEDAEKRLLSAANLLQTGDAGTPTQKAERAALVRLEGMLEAFAQTANDAQQNQDQPPAEQQAGANQQGPQRRPTFELLEVKMLRALQAELQERTKAHEQQIAGLAEPPDEAVRASLEREAQALAAEQARLAELVEAMLARDNENGEQPDTNRP